MGLLPPMNDHDEAEPNRRRHCRPYTTCLRADAGRAFTTVLAFIALTITVCPNISFLPAAVAGLRRVLMKHSPGTVNLPFFFTSDAPTSARTLRIWEQSFFFRLVFADNASAIPPLLKAVTFFAFIAPM